MTKKISDTINVSFISMGLVETSIEKSNVVTQSSYRVYDHDNTSMRQKSKSPLRVCMSKKDPLSNVNVVYEGYRFCNYFVVRMARVKTNWILSLEDPNCYMKFLETI